MTCAKCKERPAKIDDYCQSCFDRLNAQAWHQMMDLPMHSVQYSQGEIISQNLEQAIAAAALYDAEPEWLGVCILPKSEVE